MLFNNSAFMVFLLGVFLLYWALPHRRQNVLLLAGSYFFYACWNWKLLSLLLICSVSSYGLGLAIETSTSRLRRRLLLVLALLVNLGILGFFKYWNFFAASWVELLGSLGLGVSYDIWHIVLPVGISFYTFQATSYVLDVYRGVLPAERRCITFLSYISFFPQLVAGPIERASHMLPQFNRPRMFDAQQALSGAHYIAWGLIKKVVVADQLAVFADRVFSQTGTATGWELLLGLYFFAVQIYCDFSGYTDIALGCGRLLGFDLTQNFKMPYFTIHPKAFWRRWHITLTTWFRDYVFIPLGGSRVTPGRCFFNVVVVFAVSGLWHGANWTFVCWGLAHALLYWIFRKAPDQRSAATGRQMFAVLFNFHLILFTWLLFRCASIQEAGAVLARMFTHFDFSLSVAIAQWVPALTAAGFIGVEWLCRRREHVVDAIPVQHWTGWGALLVMAFLVVFLGRYEHTPFIYFQF